MEILAFKTLHIVGFVAWFAGLFYLVRMFVYHTESFSEEQLKKEILAERYALMEKRVYSIICNPAMIITWIGGLITTCLYGMEWFKASSWLHIKLVLLVLLTVYHLYCKVLMHRLEEGKNSLTSFQYRLFNEIPSLFLIAIVILAVFKNLTNVGYAILIVFICGIIFYIFAKLYEQIRKSRGQ
jgi:putative membrane protein